MAFTHDVERLALRPAESCAFTRLIRGSCLVYEEHRVSAMLAYVTGPYAGEALEMVMRRLTWMWLTSGSVKRTPEREGPLP